MRQLEDTVRSAASGWTLLWNHRDHNNTGMSHLCHPTLQPLWPAPPAWQFPLLCASMRIRSNPRAGLGGLIYFETDGQRDPVLVTWLVSGGTEIPFLGTGGPRQALKGWVIVLFRVARVVPVGFVST